MTNPPVVPSEADTESCPATDHDALASRFLAEMIGAGVAVDATPQRIGATRWAIHARVAYDGEVIVAEFDAVEIAQHVIEEHPPLRRGRTRDPGPPGLRPTSP